MIKFKELVASVFNVPVANLTLQSGPENLPEWDSLAHMGVITAIEQTYHMQFTTSEILSVKAIADLVNILEERGVTFMDEVPFV